MQQTPEPIHPFRPVLRRGPALLPSAFKNSVLKALDAAAIQRLHLHSVTFELQHEIEFPGSPIRNLYMTGPHCHPGGGLSAMGTITANVMLEDFGLKAH